MTVAQAIRVANRGRPVSYRERSEALRVLGEAIAQNHVATFHGLARAQQVHLDKLMESRP